jgi:hypothetical protein
METLPLMQIGQNKADGRLTVALLTVLAHRRIFIRILERQPKLNTRLLGLLRTEQQDQLYSVLAVL